MNKFFIEIGSADFDTLLPLAENGWNGILIEPNKYLLDNNDIYDNVIYENIALNSYNGTVLYTYYDESLYLGIESRDWARGVGTIDSRMNHMNANLQWKEYERTKMIECLTLDSLLDKYNVTDVDFMKVDVEGNEYSIFSSYSWRVKPSMIKMETSHWLSFEEYYGVTYEKLMIELLRKNDYLIWRENGDLYAIR